MILKMNTIKNVLIIVLIVMNLKNLTSFIIKGYIYGYYTNEQAKKISELFEINNTKADFNNLLLEVNNTEVLNKKK